MCVKSCPSGDNKTIVDGIQPKLFNSSKPGYFVNGEYFPGTVKVNYRLRYSTKIVLGKYCMPDSEALKDAAI